MSHTPHTLSQPVTFGLPKAALGENMQDLSMTVNRDPIAIIGIGCRFPGANNPETFWQLLRQGVDAVTEVPSSRWDVNLHYDPDSLKPDKTNSRWGGFIPGIENFDPQFFSIAPREVPSMDPQQRLIVETAWEALADGGQIPERLAGTKTGVFIGVGAHDYSVLIWQNPVNDGYATTGTANSIVANRVSYLLDLKGPSIAIDTACSSSLVAVHLACQSIWLGESTMALAGGVSVLLNPNGTIGFTKGGFLSNTGRCQSFDASANGYVRSEGAGVVVLKPLPEAQRDGDRIYGVIKATVVNQDGRTEAIAVPNLAAQISLLQQAYQQAGLEPSQIQYVEAHGTGTKIGDFIELQSLGAVLSPGRPRQQPCIIGSVKSNIGHLETASGIAGLIKTLLAIHHRQIPPSLHFHKPNPNLNLHELGLEIATRLKPWVSGEQPLRAGINSFGFGGTNAHVVLESNHVLPEPTPSKQERPWHLLTLTAKNLPALKALSLDYEEFLQQHVATRIGDLCYTANTRRSHFNHRLVVIAENKEQLQAHLADWNQGLDNPNLCTSQIPTQKVKLPIVFLFTGQGSQYTQMGRELYQSQPLFRQTIDHCAEILKNDLDIPLTELLYPESGSGHVSLTDTIYAQPALFALEYALAQLWMSWGIKPDLVIGHSLGEYVASCLAGVFTLAEGLKLVTARGRLMQSLPANGAMVAVAAQETIVRRELGKTAIAAHNGKESWVLSGYREDIERIITNLTNQGIKTTPLEVSHAFHSPLMKSILREFREIASEINYQTPQINLIANLTGDFITQDIANPEYWCNHICSCVRFAQSMTNLQQYGDAIFLEIGPNPVLLGMGSKIWSELPHRGLWLPSLRSGQSDWQQILSTLSQLFLAGIEIDWRGFDGPYARRVVSLPSYPFQRQTYWYKSLANHPLIGVKNNSTPEGKITFNTQLNLNNLVYLWEHRVENQPVLPGAAYIEMALAATSQILTDYQLESICFDELLSLSEGTTYNLEIIIHDNHKFEIYSFIDTQTKTLHAHGKINKNKVTEIPLQNLSQAQQQCTQSINPSHLTQDCQKHGLNYGPRFQKIKQLWLGAQQGLSKIELDLEDSLYQIHPTVLDACFQGLGALLPDDNEQQVYLPVGVDRFILHKPSYKGESIWCHFALNTPQNNSTGKIKADFTLWDDQGNAIAQISGLSLFPLQRQSVQEKLYLPSSDNLYEIVWQLQPQTHDHPSEIKQWLIFGEQQPELADYLDKQGISVSVITQDDQQDWQNQLKNLKLENFAILYLATSSRELETQRDCQNILYLVQTLQLSKLQKLVMVTRGTQTVTDNPANLNPFQGSLWGLAKVIRQEYPNLICTCLDLDGVNSNQDISIVHKEILREDREREIAYRNGDRYVPRLHKKAPSILTQLPFALKIGRYGDLDQLKLKPLNPLHLAPDEVEIEVYSVGLNFRDLLNALGMLQGYLEEMGFTDTEQIPLGGECAGKIVALGEQVKDFQIGDEVITTMAMGSLASFVKVKAYLVVPKPDNLSFREATTIPTAFLTAYYGLYSLGNLQPGEKVLIHAGAGGVGQAAIQLAKRVGARVFVTASTSKWEVLAQMGVEKIFNSRTLDFAQEIRDYTNGEGVDVILNSFNGDYIPKNLEILAHQARFIEIGKIGIWSQQQVQENRPDIAYFPFDLLEIAQKEPELIKKLFHELIILFAEGHLQPLLSRVFPIQESTQAFRYLQQAKHIGKIVITLPKLAIWANDAYLITGGWGALGLKICHWLITQGAKRLILLGRSYPSPQGLAQIESWQQQGINVELVQSDLTDIHLLNQLFKQNKIRGVIHTAGVLADGLLINQTWAKFEQVFQPKVTGSWYLHKATENTALDFFVCFSSIVSLIGSPGQGNYVAANAFMDALMQYRNSLGLPGLTINWGPWSEEGMAVSLTKQGYFQEMGIKAIAPDWGLEILHQLITEQSTQAAVVAINWEQFCQKQPQHLVSPFLAEFNSDFPEVNPPKTQQSVFSSYNLESLTTYLQTQIAKVLGFYSPEDIDREQYFSDFGLDSLMMVEFKTKLENDLGISLETSIIADYPTVSLLANYLLDNVITVPSAEIEEMAIPAQFYQFDLSQRYGNLQNQIEELKHLRNPFFVAHEGTASSVITVAGRELINYASYNYLGLADSPEVAEAAIAAIQQYGTSVCASRILSGEIPLHQELEAEIADFLQTEACIVYVGGHTTNTTTIGHLFGKNDLILYDGYAHNSIRQGCALSNADALEFPHNDYESLAKLLKQHRRNYQQVLIAIEGIYSADGDIAPLPEIIALKKEYKTYLLVDEAHSLGVLGKTGRGIGEYFNVPSQDVDLWMGTLSKSLASCGGYIAGSRSLIEYLKYTAPGFIFSVGISPANAAASLKAIRMLRSQPEPVQLLRDRVQLFLCLAHNQGFKVNLNNHSGIIPIIVGESNRALELSNRLFDIGINVLPMIFPSVPYNGARLRFFITSNHTEEQIRWTITQLFNHYE